MRILIIEDEIPASTDLATTLREIQPAIIIKDVLRTLEDVKQKLESFNGEVDLIFMDIQLQGENILETLRELSIPAPIVFVTGYDEYITEALQYASLDYILKPISKEKVQKSLLKYEDIKKHFLQGYDHFVKQMADGPKKRLTRILLRKGTEFHFCRIEDVAYFYLKFKLVFLVDFQGQKHLTDFKTLNFLEEGLDPMTFYKANRWIIININAIKKFRQVDRVKLSVELSVKVPDEIIISQGNVANFKDWVAARTP
jgi:DNA-binding LytR/AlgR family response regulator